MKYRIVKEGCWYYAEYKWLFWWCRCCDEYAYLQFGTPGAALDHIKQETKQTTYQVVWKGTIWFTPENPEGVRWADFYDSYWFKSEWDNFRK